MKALESLSKAHEVAQSMEDRREAVANKLHQHQQESRQERDFQAKQQQQQHASEKDKLVHDADVMVLTESVAKKIQKHQQESHRESTQQRASESDAVLLDDDMVVLADAMRLTPATKLALTLYDATTLEDFCFMTEYDFESMILSETRHNRTICPLQQRKLLVLLRWIHKLSDEHRKQQPAKQISINTKIAKEPEDNTNNDPHQKPSFLHRLANPNETIQDFRQRKHTRVAPTPAQENGEKPNGPELHRHLFVPEDWREQFERDLPGLKHQLHEETKKEKATTWSLLSETLLAFRWIACGFEG